MYLPLQWQHRHCSGSYSSWLQFVLLDWWGFFFVCFFCFEAIALSLLLQHIFLQLPFSSRQQLVTQSPLPLLPQLCPLSCSLTVSCCHSSFISFPPSAWIHQCKSHLKISQHLLTCIFFCLFSFWVLFFKDFVLFTNIFRPSHFRQHFLLCPWLWGWYFRETEWVHYLLPTSLETSWLSVLSSTDHLLQSPISWHVTLIVV